MKEFEIRKLKKIFENEEMCIDIDYKKTPIDTSIKKHDISHIHSCCEIYYNISGNVSFAVEGKVYKINSKEIFIAKPNEFHNCVYHSNGIHEYYCLWITAKKDFSKYLSIFFDRKNAEGNHIKIKESYEEEFEKSLNVLKEEQKNNNLTSLKSTTAVFNVLNIISEPKNTQTKPVALPNDLTEILNYINHNFQKNCSVKFLSEKFYFSRSKINRLFNAYLNTTPTKYVENRRLSMAKVLLEKENSVQYVCEECGFSDYSHFIALFKKRFGITPLKYKKGL